MDTGEVPEWLTKGKTVLIMKDKEMGTDVTNYRPITCLSLMWKAYDMIPHSWLKKCLDMFSIAENIKTLIKNSMEQWRTDLMVNGEKLGRVRIKRGIFQGDSLSPLLFVIALIPLSMVLREVKAGYSLGRGRLSLNHLLFMDDLKLYGKNENQVDTLVNTVRVYT